MTKPKPPVPWSTWKGTEADNDGLSLKQYIIKGIITIFPGGAIRAGKLAYTDDAHNGFWLGMVGRIPKINIGGPVWYLKWTGTTWDISVFAGREDGGRVELAHRAGNTTTLAVTDETNVPFLSAQTGLLSTDRALVIGYADKPGLRLDPATGAMITDWETIASGTAEDGQVLTADGAGGRAWEDAAASGASDHGALTGLTPDDDHPQYLLADGSRTLYAAGLARLTINSGAINAGLALKEAGVLKYFVGTYNGGIFAVYNEVDRYGVLEITPDGTATIPKVLNVGTTTLYPYPLMVSSGGSSTRIGVNNPSNTGFGFFIAAALKWSMAAWLPSGTNYSYSIYNDQLNANALAIHGDTNHVGIGTSAPATRLHVLLADAATNTASGHTTLGHNSSGTPAAGFGSRMLWQLASSTTADQDAAAIDVISRESTHATRKNTLVLSAFDTAIRQGLSISANGSAPEIGFLGATPVARAAHIADAKTDYAAGDLDSEAEIISAVNAIGTKLNAILAVLENVGLVATA